MGQFENAKSGSRSPGAIDLEKNEEKRDEDDDTAEPDRSR